MQIYITTVHFSRDGYAVSGTAGISDSSTELEFRTELTEDEADELDKVFATIKNRFREELNASLQESNE